MLPFRAVIAGLAAILAMANTAAADARKLRITLQLPITNHLGVNLTAFKNKVEARTNGAFQIEIIDRARAYKDKDVWPAVSRGDIEMGTVPANQFVNKVPAVDLFQQPFLFNFDALTRHATAPGSPIRNSIEAAILKATGVRILWWQSYGSTVFFSKGKPVNLPTGIHNVNVRSYGQTASEFLEACGGKPKRFSGSKQYEAIKTGKVEMVMTGVAGVKSRNLWEVTDTITRTDHAPLMFVVIINERVWQSLSPEHRAIFAKAAREADNELWDRLAAIEAGAYKFARAKGMKIVNLNTQQVAEWRACSAPLMVNFMKATGPLGGQLLAQYGKLLSDPCCNRRSDGSFMRY